MLVISGELGFDVHFNGYGNVILEQSKHAPVAFNLRHHYREWNGGVSVVRSAAHRGAIVVEDDSRAAAVLRVTAGNDNASDLFVNQKRNELSGDPCAAHKALRARLRIRRRTLYWKGL